MISLEEAERVNYALSGYTEEQIEVVSILQVHFTSAHILNTSHQWHNICYRLKQLIEVYTIFMPSQMEFIGDLQTVLNVAAQRREMAEK